MGLIDKVISTTKKQDTELTSQELEFIMRKMRGATYTGEEFELFYTVFVKLTKELQEIKK